MPRPVNLDTFVFAKLPAQAQNHIPILPDLPTTPDGASGTPPAIDFSEPALDALSNLREQARLPEWLDLQV